MTHKIFRLSVVFALPLLVTGCGDSTSGPAQRPQIAVRFGLAASSVSPSVVQLQQQGRSVATNLVVTGSNGTLNITNVSFIVSKIEMDCNSNDSDSLPSCADFKAAPSFVKLPFGASGVVAASANNIRAGEYTELEFKIKNLEDDEDDDALEIAQTVALRTAIRAMHADFPDKASMIIEGTFTPVGSMTAVPFRTYFDAEIEVEMNLVPPLRVVESIASRSLSVDVQPALWLKRADGTVIDLSTLDYSRTRSHLRIEVEMRTGFRTVKIED